MKPWTVEEEKILRNADMTLTELATLLDRSYKSVTKKCYKLNIFKPRSIKIKHGLSYTKQYIVYRNMMSRCYNPKDKRYHRYGGRGITVAQEFHDVEYFVEWINTHGWKEGLEIDRINNDRGYFPDNIRFVSKAVNLKNRGHVKFTTEQVRIILALHDGGLAPRFIATVYPQFTIKQISSLIYRHNSTMIKF